jgi:hypothetical protein
MIEGLVAECAAVRGFSPPPPVSSADAKVTTSIDGSLMWRTIAARLPTFEAWVRREGRMVRVEPD